MTTLFSQGISRSATLVLAYLIIKKRMKLQDAIIAVKQKRSIAQNEGFMLQLIELHDDIHKLLGESTIQKWLQTKFAVIGLNFHLSHWLWRNYFKLLRYLPFERPPVSENFQWHLFDSFIWNILISLLHLTLTQPFNYTHY